ncbi:MAG: hypothetical protein IPK06_04630 [Ignavibacteriae bacterium]|nr:hypothetical protein [Ignavibacteriota bacterium]
MRISIAKIIVLLLIISAVTLFYSCNDEINGNEYPVIPPATEIINIPVANTLDNPYSPILKVGWKGISDNAIIDGFWVSWKTHYLILDQVNVQEPYFTKDVTQTIAFPSADSINKQILYVKAQDKFGNVDPIGDSVIFYTKRTLPPNTFISYPQNNSSLFLQQKSSITWKGAKIICSANTNIGEIKDYTIKVDNGNWSGWQKEPIFYLTEDLSIGVNSGIHKISVKSRNTALVEDDTPAEININFVTPTHEKEWLIVDGTANQSGSTERPNDVQVDEFYQELLSGINFDTWDIANQGKLSRETMGKYKYVLWHSDDHRSTDLTKYTGLISDYLNTKGRLLLSGWNYYSYFQNNTEWLDSTSIYGNILTDYFHIKNASTIEDALLDSIVVKTQDNLDTKFAVDSLKLFSFRKGLYKVINFTGLGAFTTPIFRYHTADTTESNFNDSVIGFGYHNSEYQIVISGFPFYYMEAEAAKKIFGNAKEFLEKKFPY